MTEFQRTPLGAYIASKQVRPWLQGLWGDDMAAWTKRRANADDIDTGYLPTEAANWYLHTVGKPGYDYRLGYLPPVPFLLDLFLGRGREKTLGEVKSLISPSASTTSFVRLADFSPDHIRESAEALFRVEGLNGYRGERSGDRELLEALLANPNADPAWLEEVFVQRLKDAKAGYARSGSWDVFTSIAWNPSITTELANRLASTPLVTQMEPVLSSLVWNPVFTEDMYFEYFSEGVSYPEFSYNTSRRALLWHGNVGQHKTDKMMVFGGEHDAPEGTVSLSIQESTAIKEAYKLNSLVSFWGRGLATMNMPASKPKITPFDNLSMGEPSHSLLALDMMYLDASQEPYRIEASDALKGESPYYPMDLFQFLAAVNIHHVLPVTRLSEEFGEDAKNIPRGWLEEMV